MKKFWTQQGKCIEFHGDRLKSLRLSQGLSLEDVAKATGCSFSAVGHWENERHFPSPEMIESLQRFFGDAIESSGALKVMV